MTLAGELVLSRNQLNESLARQDQRGIRSGAQRVSLVTSELQEVVTLTRMQPVGNLFASFPRLVRDLAHDLGKEVRLEIEGGEVEIDKTILEGLSDPLTHMVRNAVDHGIESPGVRAAAGKPPAGTVRAEGLSPGRPGGHRDLRRRPGLDAQKVAASALAKGLVPPEQLQTMPERDKMAPHLPARGLDRRKGERRVRPRRRHGRGQDQPGQAGRQSRDRFGAGPGRHVPDQAAADPGDHSFAAGLRWRRALRHPASQRRRIDPHPAQPDRPAHRPRRRRRCSDPARPAGAAGAPGGCAGRAGPEPRGKRRIANVVLVDTGAFEYGLVVEELHDTAEIVVKPLGRHLQRLPEYAGATILGDGRVAVILDVAGLAARAGLSAAEAQAMARRAPGEAAAAGERHALLMFHNAPGENCAIPIDQVARVERVNAEQDRVSGRPPHLAIPRRQPAAGDPARRRRGRGTGAGPALGGHRFRKGRPAPGPAGRRAAGPGGNQAGDRRKDAAAAGHRRFGHPRRAYHSDGGHLRVGRRRAARPRAAGPGAGPLPGPAPEAPTVLVAEDSDFFRGQLQRLIEAVGCRVLAAEDGQAAWELLDRHAGEVALVATDIEMPRMDGLALTRQIRADARFEGLPIIALTSLAGEEDIAHGLAAGVTEYQVKLNHDELLESIRKALRRNGKGPAGGSCPSGEEL